MNLLILADASAYFDYRNSKVEEMNGLKFSEYRDFAKKWDLVTVRYREDSGELRFTYANELAMSGLKKLSPHYPDGAAFAKVSYQLESDFVFPSSQVPSKVRRYQLMVKNRRKYGTTDGWGYALFTDQGTAFEEDTAQQTKACVACHRIVPERDHVFSRSLTTLAPKPASVSPQFSFKARLPASFSGAVKAYLPKNYLESLEGSLRENAFSGTLDEVVPVLIERARLTERSAIFYVDEKNFSIVSGKEPTVCDEGKGKRYQIIIGFNGGVVRNSEYCLKR